ncbi:UNVERIFIED_CONTAM: hypothetical protein ABID98_002489 [Brevibacillus sp. OAP136]
MNKKLLLSVFLMILSASLSYGYFFQKSEQARQQFIELLASDYALLQSSVNAYTDEIFDHKRKGDAIKGALYLVRTVEIAGAAFRNLTSLLALDEPLLGPISYEFSLAAADISTYIQQSSVGVDTAQYEQKVRKHIATLQTLSSTLTCTDLKSMDTELIRQKLSLLNESFAKR